MDNFLDFLVKKSDIGKNEYFNYRQPQKTACTRQNKAPYEKITEPVADDYVVFDLETTGLSHTPVGGVMDRIIEIGAVKIVNGSISEKFSSFVACPVRLTDEIKQLTGIDDAMLEGAPAVKDVLADFYKFCEGCDLVAHNMAFDSSFIRFYGEEEGYLFNHRQYDTVEFAREVLVLGNYKLNTLADYFHFEFRHHRAFDDAFVTAKIFIELVRKRGGLPKPFASF